VYHEATTAEVADGLSWYEQAHEFALSLRDTCLSWHRGPVTISKAAQIISIFSPQVRWDENKANAKAWLLDPDARFFATKSQKLKALGILKDLYEIPTTSLKTRAFADCIIDPWTSQAVVIDRHAIKIACGVLGSQEISITDKRYRDISKAYITAAKTLGLAPHQVQAVTWVTFKRIVNR